ncbi:MAG TPA: hypothetical protein VF755_27170 [Catenuloplanes sp.]|jgi:hypothetical protein
MRSERHSGWDVLAAVSAAIALVMIGAYVAVIGQEGGQVAIWFLAGLAVAALLSIYGVVRAAPRRRLALAVSGVTMAVLGLVSILSIGVPILGAGVLSLVAAGRQGAGEPPVASGRDRRPGRQDL